MASAQPIRTSKRECAQSCGGDPYSFLAPPLAADGAAAPSHHMESSRETFWRPAPVLSIVFSKLMKLTMLYPAFN
eukprot:6214494-Pleurochrysis_carterae.AAC.3